jgi:hypothetical protein
MLLDDNCGFHIADRRVVVTTPSIVGDSCAEAPVPKLLILA